MDMNQLNYFISVAQTLNFTEAAKRNGITQPSISHHISELEKQLGARLFLRDRRSVTMTDAGREFLPYAMEIVETAQDAICRVKLTEDGSKGHVAIAAVTTASETLSKCLSAFAKRYPDILVDISFTTGRGQSITMNENKYDFYFAMKDMVPTGETFDYLISNVDQLCLTLPKGHPMADQPLDFSRLKGERFISISEAEGPALYNQIKKVCEAMHYDPKITNRYDTAETVLLAVGAGLGISILPQAITKVFFSDNVEAIPIRGIDCAGRTYVVAWHRQSVNPTAHLFLDVVREVLGQEAPQE